MLEDKAPLYWVWGIDSIAYGPVELPAVVGWIKQERVLPETWVFKDSANEWTQAAGVPEFKPLFHPKRDPAVVDAGTSKRITVGMLRRLKLLALAEENLLESILRYLEPVEVKAFEILIRPGQPANAMYFLLEGEMWAYTVLDGVESTLANLMPGDSFGEIALLDHGMRSAFVATKEQPCLLLKLSLSGFEQLLREAPALAMPFTLGLARSLAVRMRLLTKRYEDSIHFGHLGGRG